MMPATGRLNRRVRIERAIEGDDGHGGRIRQWREIGRASVAARPIGGKEALVAGTLTASQGWEVTCRMRDLLPADRLVTIRWRDLPDGTALNVRSVADPRGRGAMLIVLADTLATG